MCLRTEQLVYVLLYVKNDVLFCRLVVKQKRHILWKLLVVLNLEMLKDDCYETETQRVKSRVL